MQRRHETPWKQGDSEQGEINVACVLFTNFMISPQARLTIGHLLTVSRITCSHLVRELSLGGRKPWM